LGQKSSAKAFIYIYVPVVAVDVLPIAVEA